MAEAQEPQQSQSGSATIENALECAVCLQACVHPARLPCGHIFCFLCLKGVANLSARCAMCRQQIPLDYLENPLLLEDVATPMDENETEAYHWFYEGRGGWWQYDERTNAEMEAAFKEEVKVCELLIAGFLYVIDFRTMLQFRRNDPSRRRRIKRDEANAAKKGIAGIRTEAPGNDIIPPSQDENGIRHRVQNSSSNQPDLVLGNVPQGLVQYSNLPPIYRPVQIDSNLIRLRNQDTAIDLTVSSDLHNMDIEMNSNEALDEIEFESDHDTDEISDSDEWQLIDRLREVDLDS